jgi:hypothetical protein
MAVIASSIRFLDRHACRSLYLSPDGGCVLILLLGMLLCDERIR